MKAFSSQMLGLERIIIVYMNYIESTYAAVE